MSVDQTVDLPREQPDLAQPIGVPQNGSEMQMAPPKRPSSLSNLFRQEWAPALTLVILDIFCWGFLYALISDIRQDASYTSPLQYFLVDLIQLGVIIQAFYIIGGYDRNTETRGLSYTTEHFLALLAAAGVSSLIIYAAATFDHSMKPSRGVMVLGFVLFAPTSLIYRRILRSSIAASTSNHKFLVVGSGEIATRFYETYLRSPNRQRVEFVSVSGEEAGQPIAGPGSPIIQDGIEDKLASLGREYTGVVLAESADRIRGNVLDRLIRTQFQKTRVYTLESFYEAHWRRVPVHAIDPFWPLQMGFQLAKISPYHYLKRLFDLILSTLLLIFCAPIMAGIALLIWFRSGWPIIFSQRRVGRENHPFTVYKFRTMRVREPDEEDDLYTRADDPRLIRGGRWLRKLRLDELPQLWNVFRGEMSLIGPRAEWTKITEQYEQKIPFYHFRHLVKPGITGWAQVNYPYGENEQDAIEKLKYDLYYIRHYSLKLDAMIVLKTLYIVLVGKGAR